eukprot:TRINITY_DN491_c0_g1_i3.p1 TRINITY_DN491_c0_g1~~TRINITY_DN491_c0_g1_i3.p1  ORF type:complete len:322 (-),score=44.54 TRINITY_DN491_c0_g1_i3:134-1099(-)
MRRRPPRSTLSSSSAASDVYKRQLEISLERTNASYKPSEIVSGSINFVNLEKNLEAQGGAIKLKVYGQLTAQNQEKNKQFSKFGQIESHSLFSYDQEIETNLYITPSENSYPFNFKLEPKENATLLESYQGLFVSVEYAVHAEFKYTNISGQKSAQAMKLFFVQINEQGKSRINEEKLQIPNPIVTAIEPKNLGNTLQGTKIPEFMIKILLSSNTCLINEAIEGDYLIDKCEAEIKYIELQLIRIETIGQYTEATEVQVCQIAEGDVMRKIKLPLYMMLPRSYICPNFAYGKYNVNFEIIFAIILANGFKISQSIPLYFYR